jgi:hypothetical protein
MDIIGSILVPLVQGQIQKLLMTRAGSAQPPILYIKFLMYHIFSIFFKYYKECFQALASVPARTTIDLSLYIFIYLSSSPNI